MARGSDPCGTVLGMSTPSNPYRGFRYPAEIINQAVWLYHCFSLSLREVELILAARGIAVSYETIREWSPALWADLRQDPQAYAAQAAQEARDRPARAGHRQAGQLCRCKARPSCPVWSVGSIKA